MRPSRAPAAIALAAGGLLLATVGVGQASAATTNIGAIGEIGAGAKPDPITAANGAGTYTVQVGEASGSYAIPAGYGVITRWSHSTGTAGGGLTFKVYRPTGTANRFLTLAADARTVRANTVHHFPVRIPVRPGDRIGISTTTVQVAYITSSAADRLGFFPIDADPPPGSTATLDGPPFLMNKADVAARVETDLDGDGLGDDTQEYRGPTVDSDRDGKADSVDSDDDNDRISDVDEARGKTSRLDLDSDDDGLADGKEDRNRDGRKGKRETSARRRDTDRDKLTDGVERGVRKPLADPAGPVRGTNRRKFKRDRDPRTRTGALRKDSDRDGLSDGREDRDRDGRRDRGETNPRSRDSDRDGVADGRDPSPLDRPSG